MIKYRQAADILKEYESTSKSIKSILNKKFANKSDLMSSIGAIVNNCIKNKDEISSAFRIVSSEINDFHMFAVYFSELFYGKYQRIKGGGKIKKIILEREEQLKKCIKNLKEKIYFEKNEVSIIVFNPDIRIKLPNQISQDNDIPEMISMPKEIYSSFFKSNIEIFQNELLVQSKGSALVPFILMKEVSKLSKEEEEKWEIIDSCAAPGNKTLLLALFSKEMTNTEVSAFEISAKRFEVLKMRLENYNFPRVKAYNEDFLRITPCSEQYSGVKAILCDPSCSGSGRFEQINKDLSQETLERVSKMTIEERQNHIYNELSEKGKERISALQDFQVSILKHCLAFHSVRFVSYSTCSIFAKENEEVIERILNEIDGVELVQMQEFQNGVSKGLFKFREHCIRIDPWENSSEGIFIAIFRKKD